MKWKRYKIKEPPLLNFGAAFYSLGRLTLKHVREERQLIFLHLQKQQSFQNSLRKNRPGDLPFDHTHLYPSRYFWDSILLSERLDIAMVLPHQTPHDFHINKASVSIRIAKHYF